MDKTDAPLAGANDDALPVATFPGARCGPVTIEISARDLALLARAADLLVLYAVHGSTRIDPETCATAELNQADLIDGMLAAGLLVEQQPGLAVVAPEFTMARQLAYMATAPEVVGLRPQPPQRVFWPAAGSFYGGA